MPSEFEYLTGENLFSVSATGLQKAAIDLALKYFDDLSSVEISF